MKHVQNEKLKNSVLRRLHTIDMTLDRLTRASDRNFDVDAGKATWAHDGDLARIEELLCHVSDVVFREGEYGPENKA